MRRFLVIVVFLGLSAAPAVAADAPAAAAPAPVGTPAPVAAPAPAAAPEAPPAEFAPTVKLAKNLSFNTTIAFADGTTKVGKVQGVERTVDTYGDDGWTEDLKKLTLDVEFTAGGKTTEKAVAWTDFKTLTIAPGKVTDVSCNYSSETTPWMHECTLPTVSLAVLKDGSKGNVTSRQHWRFSFEDGTQQAFTAFKYTARAPDDREIEMGQEVGENTELYAKLQQQIREDLKGKFVKSVTITP